MSNEKSGYGLFIFIADWLRSAKLRKNLERADIPYADVIEKVREDYQLEDRDIAIITGRERDRLSGRISAILCSTNLDAPEAWNGVMTPMLADARQPIAPQREGHEHPLGWPGGPIVCIESLAAADGRSQIFAGESLELELLGWNLPNPASLRFSLDGSERYVTADGICISTDGFGRSSARVCTLLPTEGSWSVRLDGENSDLRSGLVSAIRASRKRD